MSVQTPKTVEALLVLTVPIVERGPWPAHDDLIELGFPIVVVDGPLDSYRPSKRKIGNR